MVGLLCLCLLFASPFVFRAWRLSHVINLKQPFDRAAFIAASEAIPPGKNAAEDFKAPIKPLNASSIDLEQIFETMHAKDFVIPEEVRTWMSDNAVAIDAWRAGAAKEHHCELDLDTLDFLTMILPKVHETRDFCRILMIHAATKLRREDVQGASDDIQTSLRASLLIGQYGTFIHKLISIACVNLTIERGLLPWLQHSRVSEDQLQEMWSGIKESIKELDSPISTAIKWDAIGFSNSFGGGDTRKLLEDYLDFKTHGLPTSLLSSGLWIAAEPTFSVRVYHQVIANYLAQCDLPFYSRLPHLRGGVKLFDLPDSSLGPGMMPPALIEKAVKQSLFRQRFGAHAHCLAAVDKYHAKLAMLNALFALEIHRRRHGVYPQDLAALDSDLRDDVPLDPFTGQDLLYRLNGDSTCVIYSVCENLYDDGGTFDDARDVGYALGVPHINQ